jgi:hypothetical protein
MFYCLARVCYLFRLLGRDIRDRSPVPTAAQNEPITDHGKTVYITHDQKVLRDELELFGFVGIPSVLVCGLLLHFLAGVESSQRHRRYVNVSGGSRPGAA